jgi:hypothetical protein
LDVVPDHFVCPITKLRSRWLRVNCRRHSNSQCTPQIFVACAGWGVEVCRCPICL